MDPALCRTLNKMSLELLAGYCGAPCEKLEQLYEELLADTVFLGELNDRIAHARQYYRGGICRHESIDSADWFAIQRIICYVLVRLYRPRLCLETGVFYGGTTCFLLNALRKNEYGRLISIDLPAANIDEKQRHHMVKDSEDIPAGLDTGFMVHDQQKERWTFIRGNSLKEIPRLRGKIDFYMHDSEHSFRFIRREMSLVWPLLTKRAVIMADDLDWSNGFYSVCVARKLYPLIITDNGKSGLRARTGIIKLDHPLRKKKDIVG